MTIAFGCACGLAFDVPRSLASKFGRCPACARVLEIPERTLKKGGARTICPGCGSGNAPDAWRCEVCGDGVGVAPASSQTKCPSCRTPIDAERTLCTRCGFDLQTGRMPEGAPDTGAVPRPGRAAERPVVREPERPPEDTGLSLAIAPHLASMPILLHLGDVDPATPEGWRWAEGLVGRIACPGCRHPLSAREVFLLAFGDRLESRAGFEPDEWERCRPLVERKECPHCAAPKQRAAKKPAAAPSPDEKIRFECPHCGRSLSSTRAKVGTGGRCPGCQKAFRVPG